MNLKKNKIYNLLRSLKLVSYQNLKIISDTCRDRKIRVLQDYKSKVIFLEKNFISKKHYYNKTYFTKNFKQRIIDTNEKNIIQLEHKNNLPYQIKIYKKYIKNKKLLDFGCGHGNFLNGINFSKSLSGYEINKKSINFLNSKKIKFYSNLNDINEKFDVITLLHVIEHLENPVKELKIINNLLKKNGTLIIETPHAEDLLIHNDHFKKFTFWSEHLMLHTEKSLTVLLKENGFKNIKIDFVSRFNLSNHLKWFLEGKHSGHIDPEYKNMVSKKIEKKYRDKIIRLKKTDTIIAICQKDNYI